MKKRLLILSIFLILFINVIYAEDDISNEDLSQISNNNVLSDNPSSSLQTSTNQFLEQEIKIPENLQILSRTLFGLKEGQFLDISETIVYIILFFGFLYFIHKVVKFLPFFEGNFKSILASIIITLLVSISGGFRESVSFFFSLGNFLNFLAGWSVLKLLFAAILIVIIISGFSILTNIIAKKTEVEKAKITGLKTGAGDIIP
jgi:hypothetical protein